jgi:hypothetical protein
MVGYGNIGGMNISIQVMLLRLSKLGIIGIKRGGFYVVVIYI